MTFDQWYHEYEFASQDATKEDFSACWNAAIDAAEKEYNDEHFTKRRYLSLKVPGKERQ
jgi:hypothetical protein